MRNHVEKIAGKSVYVGLSGGVDSAVSAGLLKKAGFQVTGVFIKVWQPDWIECNWQSERRDAMRVAAHLDIPFITLDCEKEYKQGVMDYMIAEYKAGRTPNPDVMCNKTVKFGAFYDFAMEKGADYVATGHYARIVAISSDIATYPMVAGIADLLHSFSRHVSSVEGWYVSFRGTCRALLSAHSFSAPSRLRKAPHRDIPPLLHLYAGNDKNKDQSYFIWNLKKEQLSHILFPVGNMEKSEVRRLAKKFKLPNAEKKDSQGLCFIGKIDFKDFLRHYVKNEKGNVISENGEVIGSHQGALFFTIGERHGFTIHHEKKSANDAPYFVIEKDIEQNTITVSNRDKSEALPNATKSVRLERVNWIDGEVPDFEVNNDDDNVLYPLFARSRYRQGLQKMRIVSCGISQTSIEFEKPQDSLTPGQSLVIYDGDRCLGGGVIE